MFEIQRDTEILELSCVTRPSTPVVKYLVSGAALDWPVSDWHIIRLCGVKPGRSALTSRRPLTGVSTDAARTDGRTRPLQRVNLQLAKIYRKLREFSAAVRTPTHKHGLQNAGHIDRAAQLREILWDMDWCSYYYRCKKNVLQFSFLSCCPVTFNVFLIFAIVP